jgi:mono/diheme cytochrome c family protein
MVACKHRSNLPAPVAANNDTTNNGNNNNGNGQDTTTTPVDTSICFERDILPIFLSNCAKGGCHDAASHKEGYILDSYQNIMNSDDGDGIYPGDAGDSEIYEVLVEDDQDKRMPQYPNAPLTTAQINLIKRWINEGAQNGTNCAVLCDTNNFTFAAIKPIFQQNCVGCHSATLASGGVNLSTHAGVAVVAQSGQLLGALKHQTGFTPMPQGAAKLSDCKIRQVEKWVQAGALNN